MGKPQASPVRRRPESTRGRVTAMPEMAYRGCTSSGWAERPPLVLGARGESLPGDGISRLPGKILQVRGPSVRPGRPRVDKGTKGGDVRMIKVSRYHIATLGFT